MSLEMSCQHIGVRVLVRSQTSPQLDAERGIGEHGPERAMQNLPAWRGKAAARLDIIPALEINLLQLTVVESDRWRNVF